MLLGLKKQETLKIPARKYGLNPHQYIESILWVDALTSGTYTKHPEDFIYVDKSNSVYTASFLSKIHSKARFFHESSDVLSSSNNLQIGLSDVPVNNVHYMYLGEKLSFCNEVQRKETFEFINDKLAPGGYVITSYEATAGWSEYKVILDLLKEIKSSIPGTVNLNWLDKVFYELESLALKKISTFKDKAFLNKLLYYLKSLEEEHLNSILCKEDFYTFYPYQIHQSLNKPAQTSVRFVGSLPLSRNYVKLGLDDHQKAFLGETADLMMASQRQDLIFMPFHRVDIWQKIPKESIEKGQISDFYLGCVSDFDQFPSKVTKGHLTFNFMDAIYLHLRKLFNKRFMTIQEIVEQMRDLVRSPQEIVDRLMLLIIGDQLRYTLKKPLFSVASTGYQSQKKIRFKHVENQEMFSDIKRFFTERGIIIHPESGIFIPFDQKTSMIITALTKVNEALVPRYCAEIWATHMNEGIDMVLIEKEFRSILLFFKRHYLGKFLELGLLDQVLVE